MVSKASELLPLPERPVTTTITSRGRETVMSFKLCSRAPRTTIWFSAISGCPFFGVCFQKYTAPLREAKCEKRLPDFTIQSPLFVLARHVPEVGASSVTTTGTLETGPVRFRGPSDKSQPGLLAHYSSYQKLHFWPSVRSVCAGLTPRASCNE